jgi:hypothetical protein
MMSFGAMVHNAKHVDRARRQLSATLHKKALQRARDATQHGAGGAREDLPALADPEGTIGGGLLEEGFEEAYAAGAADAERLNHLDDSDSEDDEPEAFADGDVLSWALPNINLTVYDRSAMGDEPLCVASVRTSRLFHDKYSVGATDADGQCFRSVALKWCGQRCCDACECKWLPADARARRLRRYPMRAFEFKGARINQDPKSGGGQARTRTRAALRWATHACRKTLTHHALCARRCRSWCRTRWRARWTASRRCWTRRRLRARRRPRRRWCRARTSRPARPAPASTRATAPPASTPSAPRT